MYEKEKLLNCQQYRFSIDLTYCEWLFSWISKFENKMAVNSYY